MYGDIPLIITPLQKNKKTTPKSSPYKFTLGTRQHKNHHSTKPQIAFNLVPVFSLV